MAERVCKNPNCGIRGRRICRIGYIPLFEGDDDLCGCFLYLTDDDSRCGHSRACHAEYQDQPQTTEVPDTQEAV